MPLKFYCFNCGFGTSYTLNKPKVCLNCNQVFGRPQSLSSINSQPTEAKPSITIPNSQPHNRVSIAIVADEEPELPQISLKSFANVDKQRKTQSFVLKAPAIEEKTPTKQKKSRKTND